MGSNKILKLASAVGVGRVFVHQLQIGLVAVRSNAFVFNSRFYSAMWFIEVLAVVETALAQKRAHFRKIVRVEFFFEVYQAKGANAWRVDDKTAARERVHFGKSSGVLALLVGFGNFTGAEV
jgi:hypothetical protein